ncbi:preprotein translocase subunit Sec61beta [Candidatus Micrarchaeota archaeon]|nr:preprotein translocase subunit Sec61beta [Candidatus Micrarchaeota archaeon]
MGSLKQEKVTMPMSSAGIMGFSSDIKINGLEMDPKVFVVATAVFVLLVKIAHLIA